MAEIQALHAVAKAEPSLRGDVKGSLDPAMKHLKKALTLAEPEGFVRIFADIGAPLSLLLRQAASRDISPSYANLLLEAIEADQRLKKLPPSEWPGAKDGKPPSQLEPLSERELEVLKLLNSKLSVPEIANELSVAPSTVRTHVRVIYGKLGAHGRIEAIQKAREVGLI
jgi:LuxR family maltose regulon positive regulatory protein